MSLIQLPLHILQECFAALLDEDLVVFCQCSQYCYQISEKTLKERKVSWLLEQSQIWNFQDFCIETTIDHPVKEISWTFGDTGIQCFPAAKVVIDFPNLEEDVKKLLAHIHQYTMVARSTLQSKLPMNLDDSVFPYPDTHFWKTFPLYPRKLILPEYIYHPSGPCPDQSAWIGLSFCDICPVDENSAILRLEMMTHHGRYWNLTTGYEELLILKIPFEEVECTIYEKTYDSSSTHRWHVCYEGPTDTIVKLLAKCYIYFDCIH